MKTTNFIKTNIETTVQGINVVVTTEYKQGEYPSVFNCNVQGQVVEQQEGQQVQPVPSRWFNVNSMLNVASREVQVNTSGSVPVGFIAALETEMIAARDFVVAEINAQNA